jgi:alpha-amylase
MSKRTLLQFFHWYYPDGGQLWDDVAKEAESLASIGITDVWLPPAYKGAAGGYSVGYDTYDLFDLGEFDQKGSLSTKYGSREALVHAAETLKHNGIRVIHDVVFNHKMGADETERVNVRRVNPEDRTQIDDEELEVSAYTRFTFPGRQGQHSEFVWDAHCFSGVDHIEDPTEDGIFKLVNEYGNGEWNTEVDQENGNFDYLMGANVEFRNRAVYEELKFWGRWLSEQVQVDGFRLDAAKHIPAWFFKDWVGHMRDSLGREIFVVAEYWHPDMDALKSYLDLVDQQLMLFDVALHNNFHDAARQGADFDMRGIFDGSLVSAVPEHAVTLVDNHDTQPLQSLEAPVEPWFKPLAYALILLREQGVPCVFHPDLFGAAYTDKGGDDEDHNIEMPKIDCLPRLVQARQHFANGEQDDLFDDPHCIAFVRRGTQDEPGCVVILTNGAATAKTIELGPEHGGVTFQDFLGHCEAQVATDEQGRGDFLVEAGSVSVWFRQDQA